VLVRSYATTIPDAPWAEGRAEVGGDLIEILLGDAPSEECGFESVGIAAHELVHIMGFWHTGHDEFGPFGVTRCGSIGSVARFHAAIAYARPNGNTDPDCDPGWIQYLSPQVMDSSSSFSLRAHVTAVRFRTRVIADSHSPASWW
jgi:hypothetical protein